MVYSHNLLEKVHTQLDFEARSTTGVMRCHDRARPLHLGSQSLAGDTHRLQQISVCHPPVRAASAEALTIYLGPLCQAGPGVVGLGYPAAAVAAEMPH